MFYVYLQVLALVASCHARARDLLPHTPEEAMGDAARMLAIAYSHDPQHNAGSVASIVGVYSFADAMHERIADYESGKSHRAAHASIIRPDDMAHGAPTPGAAPDPFTGAQSVVKRGRSRKGTTVKVVRHADTFVVGSEYSWTGSDGRYSHADARVHLPVARALIGQVRIGARGGRSAIGIGNLATHAYGVKMLGSDARAFAQIIPTDLSTSHMIAPYARHRTELVDAGGYVPDIVRESADRATYHVGSVAPMSTRRKLARITRRKDDPARVDTVEHRLCERSDGGAWFHVRECDAPANDDARMWVGHRLVERGESEQQQRAATAAATAARTIGHDDHDELPEDPIARATATARILNRGERITYRYGRTTGTVSRSESGTYTYSVKHDGRPTYRGKARTPDSVGIGIGKRTL